MRVDRGALFRDHRSKLTRPLHNFRDAGGKPRREVARREASHSRSFQSLSQLGGACVDGELGTHGERGVEGQEQHGPGHLLRVPLPWNTCRSRVRTGRVTGKHTVGVNLVRAGKILYGGPSNRVGTAHIGHISVPGVRGCRKWFQSKETRASATMAGWVSIVM